MTTSVLVIDAEGVTATTHGEITITVDGGDPIPVIRAEMWVA